jgi:TetR/AcrR family transcriptional regulator, cholesterol catabolism regulator
LTAVKFDRGQALNQQSEGAVVDLGVGRRERRKQEVEMRIRAVALELFKAQGFEETTVEQIAERADVAKGTFFNYFPRKDALLWAIADEALEDVLEELGEPSTWTGPALEQVRRIFLQFATLAETNRSLYRTLVRENMKGFWDRECRPDREEQFRRTVREIIRKGQRAGEVRQDVDDDTAASLIEAAYMTTMLEWLREDTSRREIKATLNRKFDVIFRGLEPVEGEGGNS